MTRQESSLPLAGRTRDFVGSIIDSSTSLLDKQTHDIVRFAMGSPAAEMIPTDTFGEIADAELGVGSAGAYDYAATEGDRRLRTAIVDMLAGTGEETTLDRVTVTSGGMQGLDLACKLFVDPGDLVVIESPTYTNGSATVLAYEGKVLEAPLDAEGMIVEKLPELVESAGRPPKAIYTVPTFQNPSGVTMSLARRELLVDLARRWNTVIIDDDPYGMLRFAGDHVPTLREVGGGDPCVFSVRTFSKIVAPGLRVGWIDAVPELAQLLINAKQVMDSCTNLPAQRLVARFLEDGHLDTHLSRLRDEYRRRKQAMQDALTEVFGDVATWTDPDGGFFLWVTLPDAVDARVLFETALAEGVAFIPGPAFSPSGRFGNALRVCFASTPPERTWEGVRRMRRALDSMLAGSSARE